MVSACGERFAAIDIGTNSTRLLVAVISGGAVRPLFATLRTTRIGEGITSGEGMLLPGPVARTIAALKEYRELLQQYGVSRWRVAATSAVRDAPNRADFVNEVREQFGWEVEVLPGKEEAYLSYLGACQPLPALEQGVVLDIGGGSTEFTWKGKATCCGRRKGVSLGQVTCGLQVPISERSARPDCLGRTLRTAGRVPGDDRLLHSVSIPLGAVRLTERPMLLSEIIHPFMEVLNEIKAEGICQLIGVGGTITTLAAIDQVLEPYESERVQGYHLTKGVVERILWELAAKDNEERKRVPGLQPQRADIIVAGTMILWAIMSYWQLPELTVSEADLLHGMILQLNEMAR